ncbi:MAG: hypothetical protein Q9160_003115 [Pyrenula sp. 1 TL-2023]
MPGLTCDKPKPALLCFHGAGSSATIAKFQAARLRRELREDFEFLFVDAPIPSIPGPGILPIFADAGPFYVWFSTSKKQRDIEVGQIHDTIKSVINQNPQANIVGVMAFSQGAIASALLILQQQQGDASWLPAMHFGVFICPDFNEESMHYARRPAIEDVEKDVIVKIPSVHLHGLRDPYLESSRKMMKSHFDMSRTDKMEFEGAHQFPNTPKDCTKAANLIRVAYQKSLAA